MKTTRQIFEQLASSGRSGQSGSLNKIVAQADGWVELQQLGSRGVVLPAQRDAHGKLADSLRKPYKLDSKGRPPYYSFLRADWRDIEAEFVAMQPRAENNEVAVCNGRVNELWNSLFTHIRNETVRARYPDTAPGTILEVSEADAARFSLTNGDIVELSCDAIRYSTAPGAFTAVVVVQPGVLPAGVVFAYFSWPAHTQTLATFPYREFNTSGYVNNLTSGWTDPVNPIAAVKYARASIRKTGARFDMPTYAARSIAFDGGNRVPDESLRLHWKVRELVVQRALPMVRLHDDVAPKAVTDALRNPDAFMARYGPNHPTTKDRRRRFVKAATGLEDAIVGQVPTGGSMTWDEAWPHFTGKTLAEWSRKEMDLLIAWKTWADQQAAPSAPLPPPAPLA